jgi:hypothetical protein
MSNISDLKLNTKAGAAEVFGVCKKTIDNYIPEGRLPKPVQFASREYRHPAVFKAFLDRTFGGSAPEEPDHRRDSGSVDMAESADVDHGRRRQAPSGDTGRNPSSRQLARQRLRLRHLNGGDHSASKAASHPGPGKATEDWPPKNVLPGSNEEPSSQP